MKKHAHAFDLLWTKLSRRKKCWKSCSMCNKCKTKKETELLSK